MIHQNWIRNLPMTLPINPIQATSKQNFGLGQGSTAASNIWCVIHGVIVNTLASAYIGFVMSSMSRKEVD
jgi:hypothetical protein